MEFKVEYKIIGKKPVFIKWNLEEFKVWFFKYFKREDLNEFLDESLGVLPDISGKIHGGITGNYQWNFSAVESSLVILWSRFDLALWSITPIIVLFIISVSLEIGLNLL